MTKTITIILSVLFVSSFGFSQITITNQNKDYIITHDADGITGDKPFVPAVKTGAGFVVGMALPSLLIGTAAFLSMMLFGNGNNGSE